MIIVTGTKDLTKVEHLPEEVKEHIVMNVNIIEEEYGVERDVFSDDGGYLVVIKSTEDFNKLDEVGIVDEQNTFPFENSIFEYVDKRDGYYCGLILYSNDFGVVFYVPETICPDELRDKLESEI
jgi:hypothetical protein